MLVLGGLGEDWSYPTEVTGDPSQQGEGLGVNLFVGKSYII